MLQYDEDSLVSLIDFDMLNFCCQYVLFIHMIDLKSIKIEMVIVKNQ